MLKDARFDWIDGWKFGSRLPVGRDKVCEKMGECLKELSNLVGRGCCFHRRPASII